MILALFVFAETGRALFTFYVIHSGIRISPTQVNFATETMKLVVALGMLNRWLAKGNQEWGFRATSKSLKTALTASPNLAWQFAVPAAAFLVNHLAYFIALQVSSPALIHVAMLAKFPITAVLHHFVFNPIKDFRVWTALGALSIGLVAFSIVTKDPVTSNTNGYSLLGPAIGLAIALVSSFNTIYTEVLLKSEVDFWPAQVFLYIYSAAFALGPCLTFTGIVSAEQSLVQHTPISIAASLCVAAITAGTGLVIAKLLRQHDNLVKLVGTAASVITTYIAQSVLDKGQNVSLPSVAALIVVAISNYAYNYFRAQNLQTSNQETTEDKMEEVKVLLENEETTPLNSPVLFYGHQKA